MSQPPPLPVPPTGIPLGYAGRRVCPGCGVGTLEDPKFTLWGGLIGHKMLGVERCPSCRRWWVKKSGQPGGRRVLLYIVIGVALGLLLGILAVVGVQT